MKKKNVFWTAASYTFSSIINRDTLQANVNLLLGKRCGSKEMQLAFKDKIKDNFVADIFSVRCKAASNKYLLIFERKND